MSTAQASVSSHVHLHARRGEAAPGLLSSSSSPFRFAASEEFHQLLRQDTGSSFRPSFPLSLSLAFLRPHHQQQQQLRRQSSAVDWQGGNHHLVATSLDVLCHVEPPKERRRTKGGTGQRKGETDRGSERNEGLLPARASTQPVPQVSFELPDTRGGSDKEEEEDVIARPRGEPHMGGAHHHHHHPSCQGRRRRCAPPCEAPQQRKRQRQASTGDGLLCAEADDHGSEEAGGSAQLQQERRRGDGSSGGASPVVNVSSLSSRVAENDDLLGDLLNVSIASPTASASLSTPRAREEGVAAVAKAREVTARADTAAPSASLCALPAPSRLPPSGLPNAHASLSVRELRAQCVAAGLLGCGTKAELLQRLETHHEKMKSAQGNVLSDEMQGLPVLSPPPASPPQTIQRTPGGLSVSPDPTSGAQRSSPPRTVFRLLHSNSGSRSLSAEPQQQQQLQHQENRDRLQQRQQHEARQRAQRRVPSPAAFLVNFLADTKARDRHRPTDAATIPDTSLPPRQGQRFMWQLLVDSRERVQGSHDKMLETLRKAQVPCTSAVLPCGDFMFNVRAAAEDEGNGATNAAGNPAEGDLYPSLLSLVVERKTLADLDGSIKGSRYVEQRRLLARSPFARVLWLIEGSSTLPTIATTTGASGGGRVPGANARHRRGQDRAAALAQSHARVTSACASLSAQPGFTVVRTRHVQDSASFLRQLGTVLTALLSHPQSPRQASPVTSLLPTQPTLAATLALQKHLRAATAFPRMLLCIRGCSAALTVFLVGKYGSLYGLWRALQGSASGPEVLDADPDIQALPLAQRKVVVLLSEFVAATEYF